MSYAGKRKREVKMENLINSNPKMMLEVSGLFPPGTTQATLPFVDRAPTPEEAEKAGFPTAITVPLPGGASLVASGWNASKKEAEKQCAIDACRKLRARNLLLLPEEAQPDPNTAIAVAAAGGLLNPHAPPMGMGGVPGVPGAEAPAVTGMTVKLPWSENPKNVLNASPVFKAAALRRQPLPIRVRHAGEEHARYHEAELDLPVSREALGTHMLTTIRGVGQTKAEAEKHCCVLACTYLFHLGLLDPSSYGAGPKTPQDIPPQEAWLVLTPDEQSHLRAVLDTFDRHYTPPPSGARGRKAARSMTAGDAASSARNGIAPPGTGTVAVPLPRDAALDLQFKMEARRRETAPELRDRMQGRRGLPAWQERDRIVQMVASNKVSLVVGETGCGKTTQVPQFILEAAENEGRASAVHILVTQPRRIAAVSVAERVAWERGEEVGKSVGFSIRLEPMPPRPRGSMHFLTTGILLRKLQGGEGALSGVSHIVIDEVHEREMDTDFMLVLVREMLAQQPELRIIIMSATVETDLFRAMGPGKRQRGTRTRALPAALWPKLPLC